VELIDSRYQSGGFQVELNVRVLTTMIADSLLLPGGSLPC
jgi:hypothetical protein